MEDSEKQSSMIQRLVLFLLISILSLNVQAQANLVITEISYNPPESGSDSLEFIEVYNAGSSSVNVTGYSISNGFNFSFPSVTLQANAFMVIAKDSLAMFHAFGYVGAYEFSSGSLLNSGEAISIIDSNGVLIDSLTYNDANPWPTLADGDGPSMVLCDPSLDNADGNNWSASTFASGIIINGFPLLGSPGAIDSTCICNSTSTLSISACQTYTVPSGDETYTMNGTYTDTIANTANCDSIITINLSIIPNSTTSITQLVCGTNPTYTVPSGNATYTVSGIYADTLTAANGCDSIITINLTIGSTFTDSIIVNLCGSGQSYTVPSGSATYTTSGVYNDTLLSVTGCDSVIVIDLTISSASSVVINPVVCYSFTSPSGNNIFNTSGTYTDTISNVAGCDSVITINLTVNDTSFSTISATTCDTYTNPSGTQTYTTSGLYTDTLSGVAGCDSIITITLTVNQSSATSIDTTVCNAYISPSGSQTFTSSGTYFDTLSTSLGCDSTFVINLTILDSSFSTVNVSICDTSYTSPSGNTTYFMSGVYTDIVPNTAGCDSIITINLQLNSTINNTIMVEACGSYVAPDGSIYDSTGVYTNTLIGANGCDSVLTINLTIVTVDSSVTQVDATSLSANATGNVTYRWLDCDNGFTPLAGETNQVFTATANGNYALVITNGNCIDTSACFAINSVSLSENKLDQVSVYPNPTNGLVNIDVGNATNVTVNIYNLNGKLILSVNELSGSNHSFMLNAASGMYFIEVSSERQKKQFKLIVE